MKQIYILLVAMCAIFLTGCSDDDKDPLNIEEGEGVITMVVDVRKGRIAPDEDVYFSIYSFKEGEIITVDWGDGSVEEFRTVADCDEEDDELYGYWTDCLEHSYARNKSYTITIRGNIKELEYVNDENYDYPAHLTSLDVSKCPALEYLDCEDNNLTSLDVSKNTNLEYLYCDNNNLTSLDVSKNTNLEYLYCYYNNLTSLDVSKNTALEYLDCENNNLTSLDVSKNTVLKTLECGDNNLTSLDVSRNTVLGWLSCNNNNLTTLDISGCTALEDLYCHNNNLSASALNKIFTDLPQVNYGHIDINGNPGTATCDKSIAEKKGWTVEVREW